MFIDLYEEYDIERPKGADGKLYCHNDQGDMSIIICPGGAYSFVSETEGIPIAEAYAAMGYKCYVLHYSVAPVRFPAQYVELSCAIDYVRHRDGGVVGVVGFSAGGHLAASVSTLFYCGDTISRHLRNLLDFGDFNSRPDFCVLCYPVISSKRFVAHRGSFKNLCGDDKKLYKFLSLEDQVTVQTPPTFIWHTKTDKAVSVKNTLLFYDALACMHVNKEVHIYPKGGHGLALAEGNQASEWVELSDKFIRNNFVKQVD